MFKKLSINSTIEIGTGFCEGCEMNAYLGLDLGLSLKPPEKITIFADYDFLFGASTIGACQIYMINGGVAFLFPRK